MKWKTQKELREIKNKVFQIAKEEGIIVSDSVFHEARLLLFINIWRSTDGSFIIGSLKGNNDVVYEVYFAPKVWFTKGRGILINEVERPVRG